MQWQSGCARKLMRAQDYRHKEETTGVNLSNAVSGTGPAFNWRTWSFLLITAGDYGWVPQGTLLDFEYQFASFANRNRLDKIARVKYENDIRRFCRMWPGDYDSNHSQLVTGEDSQNMLKALIRAVNTSDFQKAVGEGEIKSIRELMAFLKGGAFRIG